MIEGGSRLQGTVAVSGAKNAALPLLFSSLLSPGRHILRGVPKLQDIESGCKLLQSLGCETIWQQSDLLIQVPQNLKTEAHYDLVRKMRASILVLGPLLARFRKAIVSLPGGCAIGTRPIDLHLEAMRALGAQTEIENGYVVATAPLGLRGANFLFETSTVGGTENLLMAACVCQGTTLIENAAKEPEIVDLAESLICRGALISGHGTGVIRVEGVESLGTMDHRVIPDRIEAGTLLLAGAITGGKVRITDARADHLEALLGKLKEVGFDVTSDASSIEIGGLNQWGAADITTQPHPLFPTDLQAQFMALMTLASGTSIITESVFENRFMHVQELIRMRADITPRSRVAIVRGRPGILMGAPVMATDLRASACLILAGLAAKGQTTVSRIYHLDRGYENLEKKLSQLGAKIQRM